MRAVLYARVSTSSQDDGLQVRELRELAQRRGWVVVAELSETASGAAEDRAALAELRKLVLARAVDVVAVWKLDRLGRSTVELLTILDELRVAKVAFVSATDSLDTTTPSGRVMLTVIAAFAEYERSLMRERTRAGMQRAKADGRHIGRPVVELDLRPAVAMLGNGYSLRQAAAALGVSRATLRRRLQEASQWPLN